MNTNSTSEAPEQSPELAAIRHAVEKLRHAMFSNKSFVSTVRATLRQHGRGAPNIGALTPECYPEMLFQLRLAVPKHLASKGPVFPLRAGTKVPRNKHGHSEATADMKVIRKWVEDYGDTGWGITRNVIDIDTKPPRTDLGHTRRGVETWAAILADGHEEPNNTLSAVSPSGSVHFYIEESLPNKAHTLGEGIDTRGYRKGYVVAPGSHVVADGKNVLVTGFYKWRNDMPIQSVPWLAELAGPKRPKDDGDGDKKKDDKANSDAKRDDEIENPEPIIDVEVAAAMLRELNPVAFRDQDLWFELMCSFHYAVGDDGYAEFKRWCDSDKEYKGPRNFEKRWKSLRHHRKHDIDEHVFFGYVQEASREGLRLVLEAEGFFDDDGEFKPEEGTRKKIVPTPFMAFDPCKLPPRDVIYGGHYFRKFVVGTVAPGGGSKTSLVLAEMVSMATGIDILDCGSMYPRPAKVWYWNGEDPLEEVQRRLGAIVYLYSKDYAAPGEPSGQDIHRVDFRMDTLKDRLWLDSGRATPIKIATLERTGAKIATPVVADITEAIKANGIDVMVIDPFISSHAIDENDNPQIEMVVKAWASIAEQANCCIELVHHVRKVSGDRISSFDSRGASAFRDGCRDVRVLNMMSAEEAEKFDIADDRWRFFKVEGDKANMRRRGGVATPWRYLESVDLDNAADGMPADNVGVVTQWSPPAPKDELAVEVQNDAILKFIAELIAAGRHVSKQQGGDLSVRHIPKMMRKENPELKVTKADVEKALDDAIVAGTWEYQARFGQKPASYKPVKAE